jgi:hypothetical protein
MNVDPKLCNCQACVFMCPVLQDRHALTTCPPGQHIGRQMFIIPRPARTVAYTWAAILASFFLFFCFSFHFSVANRSETANRVSYDVAFEGHIYETG